MPTMETAKQVFYNPPMTLLPKRKDSTISTTMTNSNHHHHPYHHQGPTLTVTLPFPFSTRLSRLDARRLDSAASIRRSRTTPRTTTTTPRTTSLPRLVQPSARPSNTTSRSTATPSGSVAKKTSWKEGSVESGAEEAGLAVVHQDAVDGEEQETALSAEEEEWRRINNEKCQEWLKGLPEKFSSMHVVQHVVYNPNKQSVDGRSSSVFLS